MTFKTSGTLAVPKRGSLEGVTPATPWQDELLAFLAQPRAWSDVLGWCSNRRGLDYSEDVKPEVTSWIDEGRCEKWGEGKHVRICVKGARGEAAETPVNVADATPPAVDPESLPETSQEAPPEASPEQPATPVVTSAPVLREGKRCEIRDNILAILRERSPRTAREVSAALPGVGEALRAYHMSKLVRCGWVVATGTSSGRVYALSESAPRVEPSKPRSSARAKAISTPRRAVEASLERAPLEWVVTGVEVSPLVVTATLTLVGPAASVFARLAELAGERV